MANDDSPNLVQEISGREHQIAGRDINNLGDTFKPDPNNPKLMQCDCGWPGLDITADTCPKCGHNYLRDRQIAKARQDEANNLALMKLLAVLAAWFIAAMNLHGYTGMELSTSFLLTLIALGFIWVGWAWLVIYIKLLGER